MADHNFKVGDLVLAYNDGVWREAWLMRHAPYPRGKCDGFDVRWKDIPKPPAHDPWYSPSTGGWKPVNYLKHIEEVQQ